MIADPITWAPDYVSLMRTFKGPRWYGSVGTGVSLLEEVDSMPNMSICMSMRG